MMDDWLSRLPTPDWTDGHGRAALYCGDCRDVLPKIPEASIDFAFFDPPYGHHNNDDDLIARWESALGHVKAGRAEQGDARPIANDGPEANELVQFIYAETNRLLRHGGCCCCCCCGGGGPDPQFARWSLWLDELVGFKHMVIWDKGGLGMGWHYRRNYETVLVGEKPGGPCKWYGGNDVANVVRINGIKPQATDHPTPKPVELCRHFITLHSTGDDIVLDPTMGAGSTGVAALRMGRRFIGIECDRQWFDMAVKRCEVTINQFELFDPPVKRDPPSELF